MMTIPKAGRAEVQLMVEGEKGRSQARQRLLLLEIVQNGGLAQAKNIRC